MRPRLVFSALFGVAIGAAAVSLNPLQSAPAPESRAQRWEYKIVYLSGGLRADGDPAEKLTEQFNVLAKDGWEYTGPIAPDSAGRGGGGGGRQYLAFRRFKP
jgi:hypothetical protein